MRETHQLAASRTPSPGDQARNPGTRPAQEPNRDLLVRGAMLSHTSWRGISSWGRGFCARREGAASCGGLGVTARWGGSVWRPSGESGRRKRLRNRCAEAGSGVRIGPPLFP